MILERPLNLSFEADTQNELAPAQAEVAQSVSDLVQQLDKLKQELQAKNREIDKKNKEISELKLQNGQLMDDIKETQEKQSLIDQELRKAECHIELIAGLIGSDSLTLSLEEHDNSK